MLLLIIAPIKVPSWLWLDPLMRKAGRFRIKY